MSTPFNTGKILIGSKHQPIQRSVTMDQDALRLQRALLGEREPGFAAWATYIVTVISVIALTVVYL
ncbi:hypothetical protein UFOVP669_32 [uncultured Caudovirales phage]|uniref:Uncharacterized protein n=1 Tax=uncultured Caudovirales phage TaxID=2100421 RepID=A0A6J5SH78_9CAUD|nr:hypothetical protein UFOVP400_23 [uncultured Caudovirales phage]CAB4155884.1 hypothetical protein UFOVP669_32 [uncultured Caudovirales phage]CAB4213516.1 hypothetical protein UFOVP1449_39 [uncultured Caudovirales phage]